jgi:mono/diheme cytochrome c family protein
MVQPSGALQNRRMTDDPSEEGRMRKSGPLLKRALAGLCVPLAGLVFSVGIAQGEDAPSQGQAASAASTATKPYDDLISNNCLKCHNTTDWAGGMALDTLDVAHPGQDAETWEKAITKLTGRLMPPSGQKQPSQPDVDAFVSYLQTKLDSAEKNTQVGHVPLQRLSRIEFATSVKNLIGVDVDPKQVLPTEIEVDGFSNIAGALNISPTFMEQYLSAVRHLAQRAVGEPVPKMASVFYGGGGGGGGQAGPGSTSQYSHKDGYPLGTRGGVSFTHVFPADGEYHFNFQDGDSIDAGLYPRGMETSATLVLLIDGVEVARRQIGGPDDLAAADRDGPKGRVALTAKVSGMSAQVKEGAHNVTATFIERSEALSNDPTSNARFFGIGMPIIRDGLQVVGPFSPRGLSLSDSRAKIFVCEPKQESEERPCAERIARHLATEAFRRPATDADVKWLMKFYETGRGEKGGFDSGVTELITAVLSSPDFLYRAISTPQTATANASRPLNDLELASRLSFFLWNTGPDAQLLELAGKHQLTDPAVLTAQAQRMLKDPRAQSLVTDFAFSWLNFGTLSQIEPLDREFNAAMRTNFETEARLFLSSVLLENRNVSEMLTANYTFVNDSLARQYGIQGVYGPQFRKVTLKDENRWGLLGKGAFQLRTSYSDRTSPVLRGEYVLDRLMGTPPTPPPPNVAMDLSFHEGQPPTTVRQRLEAHRANPTCGACHGLIDPLGLALENFDLTGRWRTLDPVTKVSIDPTSQLSSGMVLKNASDLRHYLTRKPDLFPTVVTKRLMMYALNRELEYYDMPQVRKIVRDAAASDYTTAALISGIVSSDAFRRQGPEAPKKSMPDQKVASSGPSGATKLAQEN